MGLAGVSPVMTMPRSARVKRILALVIVVAVLLGYMLVEPYLLRTRRYEYTSADVPPSFDGLTVVLVADIHHGPFFSRPRVSNLVERINDLQPDLVLLGGDYVHRSPDYIEPVFSELAKIRAPLGVFGVLGNHDHWEGAELVRRSAQDAGIRLLDNDALWIERGDSRIKLGGVGDLYAGRQDLAPTVGDVEDGDLVMLLSHNPDYTEQLGDQPVDLVFSGHTHGGQVTLFGLWAPVVPSRYGQKYRSGRIHQGKTTVFVTNGVGTITPPIRFFAPPDITVVTLEHDR